MSQFDTSDYRVLGYVKQHFAKERRVHALQLLNELEEGQRAGRVSSGHVAALKADAAEAVKTKSIVPRAGISATVSLPRVQPTRSDSPPFARTISVPWAHRSNTPPSTPPQLLETVTRQPQTARPSVKEAGLTQRHQSRMQAERAHNAGDSCLAKLWWDQQNDQVMVNYQPFGLRPGKRGFAQPVEVASIMRTEPHGQRKKPRPPHNGMLPHVPAPPLAATTTSSRTARPAPPKPEDYAKFTQFALRSAARPQPPPDIVMPNTDIVLPITDVYP